jgi:elongation factor P
MITSNDFKTGMTIILDGNIFQVIEFLHVKPGKGSAFVRTKLKSIATGNSMEKTFRAGEKVEQAILERRDMQFLYSDGQEYTFMDNANYEQMGLQKATVGENNIQYLKEGMSVSILMHGTAILGVDVPAHVELEVVDTPPPEKGNTASGGTKPATLETGAIVQVPFFVEIGNRIRVDTRNNSYIDRA